MKTTHVTIGIPAYNEGRNIDRLLHSLKTQYLWGITLDAIVVVSDGSTDDTIEQIKSVKNRKIHYVHHKTRRGINATLNELFSLSKSEVLVLLNADVSIANRAFLHELVHPFRQQKRLGIVGANVLPLKPKHIFEQILATSHMLKKYIYDRINGGNNIYNCHGRGRALSKELYATLHIPENCPEDAFAYMACISHGFSFYYQKNAVVRFRSPQNFADHVKQSVRFSQGKNTLEGYFDTAVIRSAYRLPPALLMSSAIRFAVRYPFLILLYFIVQVVISFRHKHTIVNQTLFDPAYSSKGLV